MSEPRMFTQGQLTIFISMILREFDMTLAGANAVQLMIGTAAVESRMGYYRRQLGNGPARGIYQMEPATERDIWQNWIRFQSGMGDKIKEITGVGAADPIALEKNLSYQTVMSRLHYRRVRAPLPQYNDIKAQAEYWKKYYNTYLGKGTPEKYIECWERFVIRTR